MGLIDSNKAKYHQTEIKVRLSETDALGVVYYSNYFIYFDVARLEFLKDIGMGFNYLNKRGINFLCLEASCKYLMPLKLDDIIVVRTWLKKIGRSSVVYYHEIIKKENKEKVAEGNIVDVLVDSNKKPYPIPEEFRNKFLEYLSK